MNQHTRTRAFWGFIAMAWALLATLFLSTTAFAADGPLDPTQPVDPGNTLASVHLSAVVVTLLVGTVIPLVSGLISKANSKWTGLATIILNAITALVVTATLSDGTAVFSQQSLLTAFSGIASSIAIYYSVWKPNNLHNNVTPEGQPNGALATKGRT